MASKIHKANKASTTQLATALSSSLTFDYPQYDFTVVAASDLDEDDRTSIWSIFEDNMRDMYVASSFGWNPTSKQLELFDSLSRFVLVRQVSLSKGAECPPVTKPLIAYTMFRFDREGKENVIYCYEIQVSKSAQRRGLGKFLTQQLISIGTAFEMQKIMLTVFNANSAALNFYNALGFSVDPTSPGYREDPEDAEWEDEDQEDYKILSMRVL